LHADRRQMPIHKLGAIEAPRRRLANRNARVSHGDARIFVAAASFSVFDFPHFHFKAELMRPPVFSGHPFEASRY
jgi:hypothetical protein